MKKVLILGGSGMLGHKLWQLTGEDMVSYCTVRLSGPHNNLEQLQNDKRKIIYNINANNILDIKHTIEEIAPDVVINCIGIIKQLDISKKYIPIIQLNSLFPHQVFDICKRNSIRFIQISTDCVFSGNTGNYAEDSIADADDLYGRSKYLGEVTYDSALTLRTSIVGHELETSVSLFDWFLSQQNKVKGYSNVFYSGLTTLELAKVIKNIIHHHPHLAGLYHVASNPISKNDLLKIVNHRYNKNLEIEENADYHSNKILVASKFNIATGYISPSWEAMIADLHEDYLQKSFLYNK